MSDAVIGKEVDGYRIQAVLGRGGMGTVYKAEDVNLSRTVAIKRINPGQAERESFIHRFRSEAQALARIDSPHIVGVYALRETDIGLLIVMEYVEGGTLKAPLDRQGALSPAQAVPILEQILQAFHDAHSAGVIHRDIKPENVLLTQDGMVKVTDFGIAKLRQPDSGETVTQGGQGGTLKYMSPEQISSIDDVDARSDIYSLGMTAYEVLAGDLPFRETDTDFDIMRKVVEGKIPPPDELNPDIPSGLAQWVVGAIQKTQADRYQSAEEMLDALREADRQIDKTVTQPEWELSGDSDDVDETRTVVPGVDDRTQTAVPDRPDDEQEAPVDSGGQTVVAPEGRKGPHPANLESPEGDDMPKEKSDGEENANWGVLGGGIVAILVVLVGGYLAVTQFGGGRGETATLALTTTLDEATVLVDGDTIGTTPIKGHPLEAGPVQVEVRKEGFAPADTTIAVEPGGSISLQNVSLEDPASDSEGPSEAVAENEEASSNGSESGAETREADSSSEQAASSASGTEATTAPDGGSTREEESGTEEEDPEATALLEVTPRPYGTVLVNGEERSSGREIRLKEGTHAVTCRHPEHGSTDTTVTVTNGTSQRLTCYFEREVTVTTEGPWGRIWIDGTNTDTDTPSTLSLEPGTHRVALRRETLDSFQVDGGVVRTDRDGDSEVDQFTGDAFEIRVEPTFSRVEHAVSFRTEGG